MLKSFNISNYDFWKIKQLKFDISKVYPIRCKDTLD